MRSLLKAIGFSDITHLEDEDKVLNLAINKAEEKQVVRVNEKRSVVEMFTPVAERTGIVVRGEYNNKGEMMVEHFFPVHYSNIQSMNERVSINKRMDSDAYTVMAEDPRLGPSVIFYLQNKAEMLKSKISPESTVEYPIYLSALANDGKILLPIDKSRVYERESIGAPGYGPETIFSEMISGNTEPFEKLLMNEGDPMGAAYKRMQSEDLYSVINTTFYPCGSESDNYTIIGYIREIENLVNSFTKEEIYVLSLVCNDVEFEVCINKKDLMGEPFVGCRFKGNIWLQGRVEWKEPEEE